MPVREPSISALHETNLDISKNVIRRTQNILSSPTGEMLLQVSKELLSRSFGNEKSLSLNLTNFIIILFLKILIFIAGFVGAGSWTMFARGLNNVQGEYWMTKNEKNLYLGFLAAEAGNYGCLSKAACQDPGLAKQYAHAARALLNGYQKFSQKSATDDMADYIELIKIIEEGSMKGYRGITCDMFNCKL
ncbi:uncharacterized protein LOC129607490 [Condylostylus longicornis]|uniref:uncharacterized protein LOC129607490 n=1 Tax=Condylostylus longicornis TaxID=2530218 RepID=UPI00244E0921|nr:uncharacterized protein LOC129607490 [Condylostylus longicornis]